VVGDEAKYNTADNPLEPDGLKKAHGSDAPFFSLFQRLFETFSLPYAKVPIIHGADCVPSYLIAGGLVFVPLSIPFLEHAYGGLNWRKAAPVSILAMLNEYQTFVDEQVRRGSGGARQSR
jgi:hypothetical protein